MEANRKTTFKVSYIALKIFVIPFFSNYVLHLEEKTLQPKFPFTHFKCLPNANLAVHFMWYVKIYNKIQRKPSINFQLL